MGSTKHKHTLLERKKVLEEQIKPLRELEDELKEVNVLLQTYVVPIREWERGGPGDR